MSQAAGVHSVLDGSDDDETELNPVEGSASMHESTLEIKVDDSALSDQEWHTPTGAQTRDRTASLSKDPAVDIYSWSQCGYLAQYFVVGLIYGGLPATIYGFFLGYLAVPAYVYSTASVLCVFPWSFKFAFGLINDTRPIFGYHRKPYMVYILAR